MILNKKITSEGKILFRFYCPGCDHIHGITDQWVFNGSFEKPTFESSVGVNQRPDKTHECHVQVTDGRLIFYSDCDHALKNTSMDMVPIPERWLKMISEE